MKGKSWISYGLNLALARKGVIVNDKIFKNLTTSELQTRGATIQGKYKNINIQPFMYSFINCSYLFIWNSLDSLSGIPVYIRGNLFVQKSEITKAQFSKLLKQACLHSPLPFPILVRFNVFFSINIFHGG